MERPLLPLFRRNFRLIADMCMGAFGIFYLGPLAVGTIMFPQDLLKLTPYDAGAMIVLIGYFAVRMYHDAKSH